MAKLDNITSSIKKGVNKSVNLVKTRSKKIMAVAYLNNEIKLLQQRREEQVKEVGEKVCGLVKEEKITIPEIRELVGTVLDVERKIDEKKRELAQVRLASEEENQKQGRTDQEKTCGHEIPEGARFCPVCGRKLSV